MNKKKNKFYYLNSLTRKNKIIALSFILLLFIGIVTVPKILAQPQVVKK